MNPSKFKFIHPKFKRGEEYEEKYLAIDGVSDGL